MPAERGVVPKRSHEFTAPVIKVVYQWDIAIRAKYPLFFGGNRMFGGKAPRETE